MCPKSVFLDKIQAPTHKNILRCYNVRWIILSTQNKTDMKNKSQSGNDEFTIDEEFRDLLPPLNQEDFEQLEKNIVRDGCRDALMIWKEKRILVDGYNRYAICTKHGIPYRIELKSFKDRDAVMDWMIENQKSRRNMTKFQWAEVVLKRKESIAAKALQNKLAGVRLESNKGVDTLKTLAKLAGITRDALYKVSVILATAAIHSKNPRLKKQIDKLRNGDTGVSISSVHEELQELVGKKKVKKSVATKPKKRSNKSASSPALMEPPQDLAGHIVATLEELEQQYPQMHDRIDLYNKVGGIVSDWVHKKKIELALSQKKISPSQQ